jgi:molybdopterin/thiamine biosynthesis adenylyltransferase
MTPLRDDQIRRYARHILLPEVGGRGQERFLASAVAVEVGPGRAAEVAALTYLAAAGIGRLALLGDARGALEPSEAASGILYGEADLGRPRIDAIRARIAALNPDVTVLDEPPSDAITLAIDAGHGEVGDEDEVSDALVRGGAAASQLLARIARGEES